MAVLFILFCVASALYVERGHRIEALKADNVLERAQFNERAREIENKNYEGVINAINKSTQQGLIIEQHINRAALAGDSLRDTIGELDRQVATVSTSARIEYAHSLADVLGECTAEYIKMAKSADGHARDSEMIYQAWPKQ